MSEETLSFLDPVFVPFESYDAQMADDTADRTIRGFAGQVGYCVTSIILGHRPAAPAGYELTVTTAVEMDDTRANAGGLLAAAIMHAPGAPTYE